MSEGTAMSTQHGLGIRTAKPADRPAELAVP